MKSMMVETVGIHKDTLDKFNQHPTIPPASKITFHGFKHVYCRQDTNREKRFRAKLNYKGITLGFGHYIEPLTPQIIVEFVKEEIKC